MQRRTERSRPPAPVVWVVVLAYVLGVLDIAAGLVLILLRYDEEVRETGNAFTITWWGAAIIIAGLFVIAVASGLTRARRDARVLATVAVALSALVALIDLLVDPEHPWLHVAVMAAAVLVVLALWTGRSGRFFREVRARAPEA